MSLKREIKELRQRVERLPSIISGNTYSFEEWLPIANPGLRWDWPHFVYIIAFLKGLTSGNIKKLMLFLPPRHAKTTLVTVQFVAWTIINDPKKKLLLQPITRSWLIVSLDMLGVLLGNGYPLMKKEMLPQIGKQLWVVAFVQLG